MSADFTFEQLWNAYPTNTGDKDRSPCRRSTGEKKPFYVNQCAIRVGIALKALGIDVPKKKTRKSNPLHCRKKGHGDAQHVLRAEELGRWLGKGTTSLGLPEKKKGKKWRKKDGVTHLDYKDRKGVVFLKDYWYRNDWQERKDSPTGDHIDLWDGKKFATSYPEVFEKSKQIWFWELT